ncbi:hypothetical protein T484DRAFT_1825143 [Baffinella frigidus]|nr:hypothetical protein T484DRAFT_1825143 [Cryptophyta sp. CCMP2293]
MLDGSSARPTMRRWALLLTGVLCACGMVALLAVAVAPARAEAGSVALGEIFPGPSVFAGENRGRRAARASLEEGQSEDAAQDGAVPSDESAEEPETGAAPAGGDSTEEEAGAGEADAEAAPAKEEETEEAATAEEGEKDEAAPANEGENEEAAPAEEEEQQLAPGEEVGQQLGHRKKQARSDASAESADSAEEEKEDDSKPSDFLKGMVRRVAREVLPAAARAKLRDSSDHVEAANVQLASARKLQRDSRKEEHKAMLLAQKLAGLQGEYDTKHEKATRLDAAAASAKEQAEDEETDLKADEEAHAATTSAEAVAERGEQQSALALANGGATRTARAARGGKTLPRRAARHVGKHGGE